MTGAPEPHEYVEERLREALARDPRVGDLAIEVTVSGDAVLLAGEMPTAGRRDAVAEVAKEVLPRHRVDNLVTVASVDDPEDMEMLP